MDPKIGSCEPTLRLEEFKFLHPRRGKGAFTAYYCFNDDNQQVRIPPRPLNFSSYIIVQLFIYQFKAIILYNSSPSTFPLDECSKDCDRICDTNEFSYNKTVSKSSRNPTSFCAEHVLKVRCHDFDSINSDVSAIFFSSRNALRDRSVFMICTGPEI